MSFFSPDLHDLQQHAAFFEYSTFQGPLCLACFLHSLADPAQLDSRKIFVLREFVRAFGPEGPDGAEPLKQMLSQHAFMLADGLLSACTASQDLGLGSAVQDAAAAMCSCAPDYLPELFAERILQCLLELQWPTSTCLIDASTHTNSHPSTATNTYSQHQQPQPQHSQQSAACTAAALSCFLSLLHDLVSTYPAAARLCAGALGQSQELGAVMCAGLGCPLEAIVTPLLQIFSVLACGSNSTAVSTASLDTGSSGSCSLPPAVVRELFIRLLLLSPQLASADLKGMVMQVLLHLVATGYAMEQAVLPPQQHPSTAAAPLLAHHSSQYHAGLSQQQQHSQQSQHQPQQQQQQQQEVQQHTAALASALISGLKPALLGTDSSMQLMGCRLLAAAAARAPALLLQQLIAADACEHLFEVIRGTLSSCSMGASILTLQHLFRCQQQQQQQQGGVAAGHVLTEDLQAAAVSGLQCLATQGGCFLEHLHFGLDTLTDLLQHANSTCNTPLLSNILSLLCDTLHPQQQQQQQQQQHANTGGSSGSTALLPAAALGRLAAAVAAVLPSVTPEEAAAAASGNKGNAELQPTPELQQSCELSCRLLCLLSLLFCQPDSSTNSSTTFTTSSSRAASAKAITPHILTAAHKAQLALPVLSSRALVSGFLTGASELLMHAMQLLAAPLAAAAAAQSSQQQSSQPQGLPPVGLQSQTGKVGLPSGSKQQQLRGKGGKGKGSSSNSSRASQQKSKTGGQAASQDRLFARRTRQEQQQQQGSQGVAGIAAEQQQGFVDEQAASQDRLFARRTRQEQQQQQGSQGVAGIAAEQQQGFVDDLLYLFEGVLLHLMPAAVRGWEALGLSDSNTTSAATGGGGSGAGGAGMWPAAAAGMSEQQQVAVAMFQAVVGVLQTVRDAGASSPLMSPFLPAFCQQLLSGSSIRWTSVCLDLLALLPLTPAVAVEAWNVLLMAAVQLQGASFIAGPSTNLAPLAAVLASRVHSRVQLLELLCTNPNHSTQQQQQQGMSQHGSSAGRRGSNGSSQSQHGSSDIRRFCGVCELHKVSLCLVAAALYCGDLCWGLGDVLTAADAAVGHAGPAILSQPELLLSIVRLYAQVEQQLLSDLQEQEVLTLQSMGDGQPSPAAAVAVPPPPPAAILHALGRMSAAQLGSLHPNDVAAGWVLGQTAVLPGAVRLLLQRWMQLLLTPPAPAAAVAGMSGQGVHPQHQQQQQRRRSSILVPSDQQQELCHALLSALQQQPSALSAVLQLVQAGLDPQQQQQQQAATAAWFAVVTNILLGSSAKLSDAFRLQAQQQQDQHQQELSMGNLTAEEINSCCFMLQLLLLGSPNPTTAAAGAVVAAGGAGGGVGIGGIISSSSSILHLTRKVLTSVCTAGWLNSSTCCYLLFACSTCLTAVAAAVSSGAAAAVAGGGSSKHEVHQILLHQGVQQVLLLACRLQQLPTQHALQRSLLVPAVSAASAWLHAAAVSGVDADLLQQFAGSADVNTLMQEAAGLALSAAASNHHHHQQQQQPGGSGSDTALEQLLVLLYHQQGLLPTADVGQALPPGVDADGHDVHVTSPLQACYSSNSSNSWGVLMVPVLGWVQGLQWMQLVGLHQQHALAVVAGSGPSSSSRGAVCGLSLLQMLLLVQSQGPGLSLLLLDNITLLLTQQQQQQQQQMVPNTDHFNQPWIAMLTVLQNAVTGAVIPGACNWQYTAAATRCLAALYAAAEASHSTAAASSSSSSSGSHAAGARLVVSSPWNAAVLQAAVDRLCQKAGEFKAVAAAAMTAEAAAGDGSLKLSYRWLCEPDVQQHCQLWCADAQLLLSYVKLAATVDSSSSSTGRLARGALGLQQLQALLRPYLEQQQMLAVLCWGAGQCYSCCQALLAEDQQQQQQGQNQAGLLAHKAAACCLSMHFSGVCLALLETLMLAGCVNSQLAWLKQQVQQQAVALSQQQQQYGIDAGLRRFVSQCVEAGALQASSPVKLTEGSAVGRVQGLGLHLLLQSYRAVSTWGGCMLVCEPLDALPRLQQLLDHLQ